MVQVQSIAFITCPPSSVASGKIICISILDWKKKRFGISSVRISEDPGPNKHSVQKDSLCKATGSRTEFKEKSTHVKQPACQLQHFFLSKKREMWSDKPRQGQMMTVNKKHRSHENAIKCHVSDPILSLSKTTEEQPWVRTTMTTLQHTLTKAVNKYKYPFLKHHT